MDFPLDARFKLLAIASQVSVTDAFGTPVFYAKQKAFKTCSIPRTSCPEPRMVLTSCELRSGLHSSRDISKSKR